MIQKLCLHRWCCWWADTKLQFWKMHLFCSHFYSRLGKFGWERWGRWERWLLMEQPRFRKILTLYWIRLYCVVLHSIQGFYTPHFNSTLLYPVSLLFGCWDDHHRNPNINNKDHLVGHHTNSNHSPWSLYSCYLILTSFLCAVQIWGNSPRSTSRGNL